MHPKLKTNFNLQKLLMFTKIAMELFGFNLMMITLLSLFKLCFFSVLFSQNLSLFNSYHMPSFLVLKAISKSKNFPKEFERAITIESKQEGVQGTNTKKFS